MCEEAGQGSGLANAPSTPLLQRMKIRAQLAPEARRLLNALDLKAATPSEIAEIEGAAGTKTLTAAELERILLHAMPNRASAIHEAMTTAVTLRQDGKNGQFLNQILQMRSKAGHDVVDDLHDGRALTFGDLIAANEQGFLQQLSAHGYALSFARGLSDESAHPRALSDVVPQRPVQSERMQNAGVGGKAAAKLFMAVPRSLVAVVAEPFAVVQKLVDKSPDIDRRVSAGEIGDVLQRFADGNDVDKAAIGLDVARWMQSARHSDILPDAMSALLGVVDGYQRLPAELRDDVRTALDAVSLATELATIARETRSRPLWGSDLAPLLDLWKDSSPAARQVAWPSVQRQLSAARLDGDAKATLAAMGDMTIKS